MFYKNKILLCVCIIALGIPQINANEAGNTNGLVDRILKIDASIKQTYDSINNTFVGEALLRHANLMWGLGIIVAMQYLIFKFASPAHGWQVANVDDITLQDYIGVPDAVNVLVNQIKNPEKYRKMGVPPTKGILLTGNPGTGKSFLARAIAGETKCPFFSIAATELQNHYYGQSSAMVRGLFAAAKSAALKAPSRTAIIFIDEIDAIGGRERFSGGAVIGILETLLSEMDGFSKVSEEAHPSWYRKIMNYVQKKPEIAVVVLAATNVPDAIDEALKRPGRFDRIIRIENPDINAREKIISMYLKKYACDETITASKLATITEGMTPAAIKTIFLEAGRNAVFAGRDKISIQDLSDAIFAIKQVATSGQRMAETMQALYPLDSSVTASDILTFFRDSGGDIKKIIDHIEKIYRAKCNSTPSEKCLISKDDLVMDKE